jgi:hypothetical protein
LGIIDAPQSESELKQQLRDYRCELTGTPEARAAARYLLWRAPLPLTARMPYSALAAALFARVDGSVDARQADGLYIGVTGQGIGTQDCSAPASLMSLATDADA